jgi:hypothetical protein
MKFRADPRPVEVIACEEGWWTVAFRRRGSNGPFRFFPFRCNSWRHLGPCSDLAANRESDRILEGLIHGHPNRWGMVQLSRPGRLYGEAAKAWNKLHSALKKHNCAKAYLRATSACSSGLRTTVIATHLPTESDLSRLAGRHGFVVDCLQTSSPAEIIELLKSDLVDAGRIPTDAPLYFRRLTSSRGFFPKRQSKFEGRLVKAPYTKVKLAASKAAACGISLDLDALRKLEEEMV